MRARDRRNLLLGLVPAAVVLAVASAAFACTTYKGYMTVTGSDGAFVTSYGGNSGMTQSFDKGVGPTITRGSEAFTIKVGAHNGHTLTATRNPYKITFWNGSAAAYDNPIVDFATTKQHWKNDCMNSSTDVKRGLQILLGDHNVSSDGSETTSTWKLPSTATLTASGAQSAVCISDSQAFQGNQAPIIVVGS